MASQPVAVISIRDRIGSRLRGSRAIVTFELLIALLCVALKMLGVLKNPTLPILLVGWLSLWLRRTGWRGVGLARPVRWGRTVLLGLGIGVAYDAIDVVAITPALHRLTGQAIRVEALSGAVRGNFAGLLATLALVWAFAAFGEELAFRGYLFGRVSDLLGGSRMALAACVVLVSVLFGVAHWAQGLSGVLDSVVAGALFAGLYLASGRNLWLPIVTHGAVDTTSLVLLYWGFNPS